MFGAVLFTLLFQGLSIKPLLQKLNFLSDQSLRERYLEIVARIVALNRVLQHLQVDQRPGVDAEFYRYQEALVKGGIENKIAEIKQLQDEYPNIRNFCAQQLLGELLAIEADTYAEFIRTGRLNRELSPLLEDVLQDGEAVAVDGFPGISKLPNPEGEKI